MRFFSDMAAPSSWGIDSLFHWVVEALNSAMLALSAYTLFIVHRLVDDLLAIAGLRVLFDALSEHFWRRRRSQDFVFFGGLFAMNVCIVFHIDCGFVFFVCFTRKIAKKWLGRHNVTIAIDSVTLEKSE